MSSLTFGAFIPQGGIGEFAGWNPADAWACTRDRAIAFDQVGYDHLWVCDHVDTLSPRHDSVLFEAFTTLAAVSQATTRAGLGQIWTGARGPKALRVAAQHADVANWNVASTGSSS